MQSSDGPRGSLPNSSARRSHLCPIHVRSVYPNSSSWCPRPTAHQHPPPTHLATLSDSYTPGIFMKPLPRDRCNGRGRLEADPGFYWCPRQADSLASTDELCERPCLQPGCQDTGPHGSLSSGQGSSGWFPSVRFCSRSFRCSCPPPPTPGDCPPCSDRLITRNRREALAGSRAADLMHWMGLGTQ